MRILIVHPENQYFAGAEKVLGYFLDELVKQDCEVAVAVAKGSRMAKLLPPKATPVWIEACPAFSPAAIWRQAQSLKRKRAEFAFDLIHGWAARDWELTALTGWLCYCPVIGTLHDHPKASFISKKRQRLMGWCANYGLNKIICVSMAVRNACTQAGYFQQKLAVVYNGLPDIAPLQQKQPPGPFRFGFLGAFSERKGLRDLFKIADGLATETTGKWELHLAGSAQDEDGERLLAELRHQHETKKWWANVNWHGWVESPQQFLGTLDLLIVPSSEFDPFPTVLLEAGQMGVPVLTANVGGVPEVVLDGKTGWLFEPGNVPQAVDILKVVSSQSDLRRRASVQAVERIKNEFSVSKMVAKFLQIYLAVSTSS